MKAKSICELPETGSVSDADGILITQDGQATRMLMSALRQYIGYASGADVLGVPAPTAADAGKAPVVNETGTGYNLAEVATAAALEVVAKAAAEAQTMAANKLGKAETAANSSKVGGYTVAVVSELPASPNANTIYFVTE